MNLVNLVKNLKFGWDKIPTFIQKKIGWLPLLSNYMSYTKYSVSYQKVCLFPPKFIFLTLQATSGFGLLPLPPRVRVGAGWTREQSPPRQGRDGRAGGRFWRAGARQRAGKQAKPVSGSHHPTPPASPPVGRPTPKRQPPRYFPGISWVFPGYFQKKTTQVF